MALGVRFVAETWLEDAGASDWAMGVGERALTAADWLEDPGASDCAIGLGERAFKADDWLDDPGFRDWDNVVVVHAVDDCPEDPSARFTPTE